MNPKYTRLKYVAWPVLALAALPLLALLLLCALFMSIPVAKAGVTCAITPLVAPKGKALSDEEFQSTLIGGVNSLIEEQGGFKTAQQKILDDLGRSDKEVKAALEDLTKVKNTMNTTTEDLVKRMEKVQRQVKANARSSFRNPVERVLANEETRFVLNAMARVVAFEKGLGPKPDEAFVKAIDDYRPKAKALTGVDAGLGQATVPTDTFNEIYDLMLEYGDYATLGVQRVGARLNVLPIATARPQFYWIGSQSTLAEGSTITSGAFTGTQVLNVINTCAVLMYIARELLADSTVDLAPYVLHQMIESSNWGLDTAAFIGNGNQDTTNAGYIGIFNAALANTNLAYVAGAGRTGCAILKLDDFLNTMLTVSPEVLNRKPKWWAHSQNIARAALIRDNNGRPIFQTWLEVPTPGAIGSILGSPIHPTAVAPNVDGPSTTPFVFGDPMGQNVAIRADLELATSDDIGFPQNLRAFRALVRAGVKMKTVAASTTLKPFAVLNTAAA
ncbi:MAG: phage major capsid protein [Verrucomicrobiae bacterium]|nr:phage major capsid protein [Verrucomicrobiae bacterium]